LDIHPSKTTSPDICVHASPNPPSPLDKYIIYHVVSRGYFHGMTHVLGTTLIYYLELFDAVGDSQDSSSHQAALKLPNILPSLDESLARC